MHNPQHTVTAGAVVAAFLEQCGVKAAFGVISIHNMPILDAFAQRGAIRFISARGEAGAGNMADAYARSTAAWACASPAPARPRATSRAAWWRR